MTIQRAVVVMALALGVTAGPLDATRGDLSAQAGTGSIIGTIKLTVALAPALSSAVYGRRGVAPKPGAVGSEIRNVVIFVAGERPASPPPPMRATIVQRNERFVPPLTAITVGSTVDFPNDDPFFHNVFSLSRAGTFDLGRYPSGDSRARQFTKPGIVKVFCHLHSQMSAVIVVHDHPWFSVPSEDGSFTISAVPAGERTVVAWHERIGERREVLRIAAGGATRVAFTLPVLEPHP